MAFAEYPGPEAVLEARRVELTALAVSQGPRLLATARGILRDRAEAEDAVQDALVSALRCLPGFEGRARLSTWLHRLVVNAALMRHRARRRRRETPLEAPGPDGRGPEGPQRFLAATPPDGSPQEALEHTAARVAVRTALAGLPAEVGRLVRLRDFDELDVRTVARRLRVSPEAVRMRHYRARKLLRARLLAAEEETGGP